jgi:hypothetical protein
MRGILKAQYNEILSYKQVLELLNNLTHFNTFDLVFDISSDSVHMPHFLPPINKN